MIPQSYKTTMSVFLFMIKENYVYLLVVEEEIFVFSIPIALITSNKVHIINTLKTRGID